MHSKTDGWTYGQAHGWMDAFTDGWTDRQTYGRTHGLKDELMDRFIQGLTDSRINLETGEEPTDG